jgi:alpha-D-ribose 1-methylphosphonate 5-triphosphate synthase subunit PhnL
MAFVLIENLYKSFQLHTQGNVALSVFKNFNLTIQRGESLALVGPSGAGKSTLLRLIYGNYRLDSGKILIQNNGHAIDISKATPRTIMKLRRYTVGYVSQFLRVIPRVPALDIVMEPLIMRGASKDDAGTAARGLLERLRIPERLWHLSPTTFSGGEQQRINLACSFIAPYPLMILDEPTASLDSQNTATVKDMIQEKLASGITVVGIYHDPDFKDHIATRMVQLSN